MSDLLIQQLKHDAGLLVKCEAHGKAKLLESAANEIQRLQQELNNRPSQCVNLSMKQIKSIAEFVGFAVNTFNYSDDEMKETEFVISESAKVDNEDGTYYEGMTIHCAEYPEEGFFALEDNASIPTPPSEED